MKQFISSIILKNGREGDTFRGRTVATETGLPPKTEVEYAYRQHRQIGTGYTNSVYHICGTDDALIIRHNDGPAGNICWDNVEVVPGYFVGMHSYGIACKEAASKYNLPVEVCLAVGPELCEEFAKQTARIVYKPGGTVGSNSAGFAVIKPYCLDDGAINELFCGINRCKTAILSLLASSSAKMKSRIYRMGQKNTRRIAGYIVDLANN